MSIKQGILALLVAFLIGAAVGRYSLPAKVVTKTIVQRVDHSTIQRVETKRPDGTDTIVTSVKRDVDLRSENDKTVTNDVQRWSLLGVAGIGLKDRAPAYGAEINYRLLGPVEVGAVGLTSGFVGVSVGIRF